MPCDFMVCVDDMLTTAGLTAAAPAALASFVFERIVIASLQT